MTGPLDEMLSLMKKTAELQREAAKVFVNVRPLPRFRGKTVEELRPFSNHTVRVGTWTKHYHVVEGALVTLLFTELDEGTSERLPRGAI